MRQSRGEAFLWRFTSGDEYHPEDALRRKKPRI